MIITIEGLNNCPINQYFEKFAEILDGSLRITNAVQSLSNEVLDAIKRKNPATLEEFMKGLICSEYALM